MGMDTKGRLFKGHEEHAAYLARELVKFLHLAQAWSAEDKAAAGNNWRRRRPDSKGEIFFRLWAFFFSLGVQTENVKLQKQASPLGAVALWNNN